MFFIEATWYNKNTKSAERSKEMAVKRRLSFPHPPLIVPEIGKGERTENYTKYRSTPYEKMWDDEWQADQTGNDCRDHLLIP